MFQNPYSFQDDAVLNVANDFYNQPNLKTLLVIPTGGGKTRTAVKSIFKMHEQGFFDEADKKILWVAHREELLEQAKDAFEVESEHPFAKEALSRTIFQSNQPAGKTILQNDNICLVVIDEAHHSAASTYLPLFRPSVGVLGLTATPSRHDGKPLEFDGESYSIGFPDMEDRGVVLKPTIVEKQGSSSDISSFEESSMEQLNTQERNEIIRNAILENPEIYKKVIIYVGSKKHAKDLCESLKKSPLSDNYESISYVLGGDGNNSRSQTRKAFFEAEKNLRRSIVVNVQVMTEGYDDPSVNTVVMAAPLRSKLTYMQCMGRAIRRNPSDPNKKAFIIEIADDLPNIKYRIDNRWIYSEISDVLEPRVVDREYWDRESFNACLIELYKEYNVPEEKREIPEYDPKERYQVLFFKQYKRSEGVSHIPVILAKHNRREVQNWFNYLSVRFALNKYKDVNREQVMGSVRKWWGAYLADHQTRLVAHSAMENSLREDEFIHEYAPWISFGCLRKVVRETNEGLDQFLKDSVNEKEVRRELKKEKCDNYCLIKFPLPLGKAIVKLSSLRDLNEVEKLVSLIKEVDCKNENQESRVHEILSNSTFPFESKYLNSLAIIVRENTSYIYKIV